MLLNHESSQLVLIDYQENLMPAIHEADQVFRNAMVLATLARKMRVPVYGTEHVPEKIGCFIPELAAMCKATMRKTQFSACPEGLTDLLLPKPNAGNARSLPKHLQKPSTTDSDRPSIVIAGVEAHVCLLQTALDLLNDEMEVWVVTDACGSRTERNRDAAFDRLAGNGAELVTTEMVVFEWLESAENEHFKFALDLIK
ncbi:MAG: isochorismatase family protein [Gammaproteobacteria bacterium]|nr:isochorismatase family protein [Gammaproteobacteria bacterium]MBU0849382.1 isochorismatase family protein [Gammaproteobacteria bacterium]MBU1266533.1 isochorismatase family protein [Gammaproteobacteria bacterium]MBU1527728.1 isochorismatase family protein [Gammaproteobacteria bacterium]MBU1779597.1 isochorismatase family protein [Gammaproteobacteria bacterium]